MTEEPERDIEYCRELQDAMDGKPHMAVRVWRLINEGRLSDVECWFWARHVSERVVRDILDAKPSGAKRGSFALKALGLYGHIDDRWEQRHDLEGLLMFEKFKDLDGFENLEDPDERISRAAMFKMMQSKGHYADLDENEGVKRIDRLRKEIESGEFR